MLARPVTGQGHGRGILGGAELTREGPVHRVPQSDMVLKRHVVDEPLLLAETTLECCLAFNADLAVVLLEVPLLQDLLACRTGHLLAAFRLLTLYALMMF